ncbi:MAG: hypothetical protein RMJ19_04450 [Gemmatales bacterium]|nr:hypothetical protein [Gemmatales bacterium]MDW8174899.1 hypothetical protein [Gemmatales bacterium]
MMPSASEKSPSRIPVRIHRNVEIVVTEDAYLATELLRSQKLAPYLALRLADNALLVIPQKVGDLIKALKEAGYLARVVSPGDGLGHAAPCSAEQ